mmetsp:Transcript_93593/g.264210  ORF Transcript_93593/g.264210 Transcript_93593/m.264210 type:complete len:256 (+) Transcript_93593:419-1186(+)
MINVELICGYGANKSLTMREVCEASSRLGVTMRSLGVAYTFGIRCTGIRGSTVLTRLRLASGKTYRVISGKRKASVFPEPVIEVMSASSPDITCGSALACSTFGLTTSKATIVRTSSSAASLPLTPSSSHEVSAGSVQLVLPSTSSHGRGPSLLITALYIFANFAVVPVASEAVPCHFVPSSAFCGFFLTFTSAGISQSSSFFALLAFFSAAATSAALIGLGGGGRGSRCLFSKAASSASASRKSISSSLFSAPK